MDKEFARAVEETRAFIGSRQAPDLTARVMSAIDTLEPGSGRMSRGIFSRLIAVLWEPRQISFRPAFGLAGATAILAVFTYAALSRPQPAQSFASQPVNSHLFVQFRLDASASRVQLAGSFTNWEPRYELHQSAPGVWTITVPLTQGVHDYAFVVDGREWVADPYALQISDGFGGTNSRLALLPPDTPQL